MVSFTYPARAKKLLILVEKKIPQAKKYCSDSEERNTKKVFKKRPDPRWAVYLKSSKKGGPKTIRESPRSQDSRFPRFVITINPSPECPTFSDLILSKLN